MHGLWVLLVIDTTLQQILDPAIHPLLKNRLETRPRARVAAPEYSWTSEVSKAYARVVCRLHLSNNTVAFKQQRDMRKSVVTPRYSLQAYGHVKREVTMCC